ncbi:MAG: DUF3048 domain-containing protein [Clostridia bacterium]|nr:DUF3048 domain-containing protein [Clostridia bacterium]
MKKSKTKLLIIFLILAIIAAGIVLAIKITNDQNVQNKEEESTAEPQEEQTVVEEKPKIFAGDSRPIAVMIDNSKDAWPQAGLNQAYIVYEIIVEGGETRLMALFKGQDLEKIGPVRSSRHYFLDYVLENDAIYTHFGWSPRAEYDIPKLGINNVNGLVESSEIFWRVKDKYSPHNAVTSTAKILKSAESKKYRTTSTKESVLNYVTREVELTDGLDANVVSIPHSQLQKVKYEYDVENKVYKRYARNKAQTDWDTGAAVTTKNIIITFCNNINLPNDSSGRQDLKNIGTFDGYYITNGKAIKIKCIKESREKQTIYQDADGNKIEVNDGNTFIHICPIDAKVTIE